MWTVAAFGLRVFNRAQKEMTKITTNEKEYIPSAIPITSPVIPRSNGHGYLPHESLGDGRMARGMSWTGSRQRPGEAFGDWKGR